MYSYSAMKYHEPLIKTFIALICTSSHYKFITLVIQTSQKFTIKLHQRLLMLCL